MFQSVCSTSVNFDRFLVFISYFQFILIAFRRVRSHFCAFCQSQTVSSWSKTMISLNVNMTWPLTKQPTTLCNSNITTLQQKLYLLSKAASHNKAATTQVLIWMWHELWSTIRMEGSLSFMRFSRHFCGINLKTFLPSAFCSGLFHIRPPHPPTDKKADYCIGPS